MDYDDEFDDDNREDKLSTNSFESKKLSTDAKETKKLMKEKGHEGFEDDFSDDDDQEFVGVEDLLEKTKTKDPKTGEKRSADAPSAPGNSKKVFCLSLYFR